MIKKVKYRIAGTSRYAYVPRVEIVNRRLGRSNGKVSVLVVFPESGMNILCVYAAGYPVMQKLMQFVFSKQKKQKEKKVDTGMY